MELLESGVGFHTNITLIFKDSVTKTQINGIKKQDYFVF